jgi:hypothetical protein
MLDWLRYRYALWRLERAATEISHVYYDLRAKAKENKSNREELDRIFHDEQEEYMLNYEEKEYLISNFHLTTAHKHLLPTPGYYDKEKWEEGNRLGRRYLNRAAIRELRSDIRKERAESRQDWQFWLTSLAVLTGLVGAATGLIAVWRK